MVPLEKLRTHLDQLLRIAEIGDWSNALNGLQLENGGEISRIGAAVDACEPTITLAAAGKIDLLLVHHGLFWPGLQPIRGGVYRKLKTAMDSGMAIYSAHLPLDLHPEFGNNALLCKALGFRKPAPFFAEKGSLIGLKSAVRVSRPELAKRLEKAVGGPVKLAPGGPEEVRNVGVVTGGAGGEIYRMAEEGIDTLITGEGPHWSYTAAEELGLNLFYAGHYATETFGVKALAEHLSRKFKLPWEFIDHPTGL